MKKTIFTRMAAAFAAVILCTSFAGCGIFRPGDGEKSGAGRETVSSDSLTSQTPPEAAEPPVTTDTVTAPPETTQPPVTEKRVSILAVGDNLIHEAVFTDAKNRAADGAAYDFVPMYAGVADAISAADISFINHECPIAGNDRGISGYPTFNSPTEAGQALSDVGFDVINLANNHILDKRADGARATVEFVQSLPVTAIGAYRDEADRESLRITEVNGIRIAWLSYFDVTILGYTPNTTGVEIALMGDEERIKSEIKNAKENADFVIVSAHWGREQYAVTDEQRRMASLISEAGADVILGHHSHIIQPVEWHENANGSRTLVVYSLGNFLSTQYYAYNMVGGMLTFDIVMENGACAVENPILNPTVTQYSKNRDGLQIYLLEDYTEEYAKAHGCTVKHSPDFSVDWIYRHVKSIVSEEFLPAYFE